MIINLLSFSHITINQSIKIDMSTSKKKRKNDQITCCVCVLLTIDKHNYQDIIKEIYILMMMMMMDNIE